VRPSGKAEGDCPVFELSPATQAVLLREPLALAQNLACLARRVTQREGQRDAGDQIRVVRTSRRQQARTC